MNSKQTNHNSDDTSQKRSYYSAVMKQNEKTIQDLHLQVDTLMAEKTSILNSFSFKLGHLLTFPFRTLLQIFKPSKKKAHNPIKATCDTASFTSGFLEVTGWAISNSSIEKVAIYIEDSFVANARLGMFRKDVLKAFPDNEDSEYSGFVIHFKQSVMPNAVKIEVYDTNDNCVQLEKIVLPATNNLQFNDQYQIMLHQQESNIKKQLDRLLNTEFSYKPLITIVLTADNTPIDRLNSCIKSVVEQHYSHWQLCICHRETNNQSIIDCLKIWQKKDQRIHALFAQSKQLTAAILNKAIEKSCGEYIAILPATDELRNDALLQTIEVLNRDKSIDLIYCDDDTRNKNGRYCNPHFKSDFNLDALLSWNYIGRFAIINKKAGDAVGWFGDNNVNCNNYDLYLKLISENSNIHHIAQVLHHKCSSGDSGMFCEELDKRAIQNYLTNKNVNAEILNGLFKGSFRIKRKINAQNHVSIIIPFKDQVELLQMCVQSLLTQTDYKNFSILLINNQSENADTLAYCHHIINENDRISLYDFDELFNYARINNWAIKKAKSEYILLLNNDIKVIDSGWLSAMVEHIQRPAVAAVGAKLLFSDNTIQHAGVVVSTEGAVHNNRFLADGANGYFNRANYIQNVSACTAACLLLKKSVFLQVGGFDEKRFAIAYNDVDLCLKIRQAGYLITYTPYAKLYHYESQSRGQDLSPEKLARFTQELQSYQQKWAEIYKNGDPYLNPNLAQASEKITLNLD